MLMFEFLQGSLMAKDSRNSRKQVGQRGEDLAVASLGALGYEILARNWRTRRGEIDIVAQDSEWLVFVEVRTRRRHQRDQAPSLGTPEESVTPAKQAQLVAMAETYLLDHPWDGPWRIDVIAIEIGPTGELLRLAHLKDAVEGMA
jgi:putative endonuclease